MIETSDSVVFVKHVVQLIKLRYLCVIRACIVSIDSQDFSFNPNASSMSWNAFAIAALVCDWQGISSCRHLCQFGIPPEVHLCWEGTKACRPHAPDEPSMPQTHDGSVMSMRLSQNGDNQDAPVESHTVILSPTLRWNTLINCFIMPWKLHYFLVFFLPSCN